MASKLDEFTKMSAKQKILVALILSALIVGGYYYLYYQEAQVDIKRLESQYASLQATIKEQQLIAGNLEAFRKDVQQLETQLSHLLEQLPNSAEIPSLLKSISDMGKEAGLEFIKFSPSKEVIKGFYAEIPVAITVSGDYHSFVQFADQVSQYPRIVNLMDINFSSPKSARGGLVRSTISCTATTFRFLDDQAKPDEKGGSR